MLEKVPAGVGRALRNWRAGADRLASNDAAFSEVPVTIEVRSPAFANDGAMPARYCADGPGLSPPLDWRLQSDAASLVLIVEDADSPTREPLVHAIAWKLRPGDRRLPEGTLSSEPSTATGRNSYLRTDWLPPDPPTGHGPHRYAFQLFALDRPLDFDGTPGRTALLDAMRGHVLARGMLVGTYERRAEARRSALAPAILLVGAGLAGLALWRRYRRKAR